ncbi:MAG: hypothetical protein ACXWU1_06270 [Allosphingosinicella sp.]
MVSQSAFDPDDCNRALNGEDRLVWQRPEIRRMVAGKAENGLTPALPDGGFSTS